MDNTGETAPVEDEGIIGRIEPFKPDVEEQPDGVVPPVKGAMSIKLIADLKAFDSSGGTFAGNTSDFFQRSGRGEYASAMAGRNIDVDAMLWAIRDSRTSLQSGRQDFKIGIAVGDDLHPESTAFLRDIPAAEVEAIDKILTSNGTAPNVVKYRDQGFGFSPKTLMSSFDRHEGGEVVEEFSERIDGYCQDILLFESEFDLLRAELDATENEFETGAPELADKEYTESKRDYRRMYDGYKVKMARCFIDFQTCKQMLADFSSKNPGWANNPVNRSNVERALTEATQMIDNFKEFVGMFKQKVEKMELVLMGE